MNSQSQRESIINDIKIAVDSGARADTACAYIGLSARTLRRWQTNETAIDKRPSAIRPSPKNALSLEEKQHILSTCNQSEYANLPPSQIVPKLADRGIYLASEASFYRVLRAHQQVKHRGRATAPQASRQPIAHTATGINQIWTWDITYLPSTTRGRFYYLYCVQDLFSRKIVAWEIHEREAGEHAANLMAQAKLRERCPPGLVLHSDNGAPMKSQTLRIKLNELGITHSHSRPSVSNDNAYIESLFRTLKYVPNWPKDGFESLNHAREWVLQFVQWYHHKHQHSGINFVTPQQKHDGLDIKILKQRALLYQAARNKHPERWTKNIRNWQPRNSVTLNPASSMQNQTKQLNAA